MLNRSYFDGFLAYFIGRSILSWNSSYVQDFKLSNGIIVLKEVIGEDENGYVYSEPVFIFGGSMLEVHNIGGGVDYIVFDWYKKDVYFCDCLFLYKDGKKFKYELLNGDLDKILKEFIGCKESLESK